MSDPRAVVQVDKRTRRIIRRFESVDEASRSLDGEICDVRAMCRLRSANRAGWFLRYEDEFDPDEDLTGRKNCPVIVVDTVTNRAGWFASKHECAEKTGLSYQNIVEAARKGHKVLRRYRVVEDGRRLA